MRGDKVKNIPKSIRGSTIIGTKSYVKEVGVIPKCLPGLDLESFLRKSPETGPSSLTTVDKIDYHRWST